MSGSITRWSNNVSCCGTSNCQALKHRQRAVLTSASSCHAVTGNMLTVHCALFVNGSSRQSTPACVSVRPWSNPECPVCPHVYARCKFSHVYAMHVYALHANSRHVHWAGLHTQLNVAEGHQDISVCSLDDLTLSAVVQAKRQTGWGYKAPEALFSTSTPPLEFQNLLHNPTAAS